MIVSLDIIDYAIFLFINEYKNTIDL